MLIWRVCALQMGYYNNLSASNLNSTWGSLLRPCCRVKRRGGIDAEKGKVRITLPLDLLPVVSVSPSECWGAENAEVKNAGLDSKGIATDEFSR